MAANQLTTLPTFDGSDPSKLDEFIFVMQSAQVRWGWSDDQLASAVKSRLTGEASSWLFAETKEMKRYPHWEGPIQRDSLRWGLQQRFGETVTQFAAMSAVRNLNQKSKESCDAFYDRVKVAVDKRNHTYSAAYKATRSYQRQFQEDVLQYFSTGLRDKIRHKVLLSPATPTTAEGWRQVARRVEAELKSIDQSSHSHESGGSKVHEVQAEDQGGSSPEKSSDWDDLEEALTATVAALQARGRKRFPPRTNSLRGGGRGGGPGGRGGGNPGRRVPSASSECYECHGKGHFAYECPSRTRKRQQQNPPGNRSRQYEVTQEAGTSDNGAPAGSGGPETATTQPTEESGTAEVGQVTLENWW